MFTPLYKNYPKSYAAFCDLDNASHRPRQMGFHVDKGEVYRFTNRFRVAKAFLGINLDNYAPDTTAGYDALLKVFLAYSAFELFLKMMGQKQSSIMGILTLYNPGSHIDSVVRKDTGRKFYAFVHKHLDKQTHKQNLDDVYNKRHQNITYIASSIRHIFAHGHLSAHANGCNPQSVKDICDEVFDFHMNVMDTEFSKVVSAYKSTI